MTTIEKMYTASATAIGGREGRVSSSDNVLDLQVRIPIAFGGPGGPYSNATRGNILVEVVVV